MEPLRPSPEFQALIDAYSKSKLRRVAAALQDTERLFRSPLYAYFNITPQEAANYLWTVRKWDSDARRLQEILELIRSRHTNTTEPQLAAA